MSQKRQNAIFNPQGHPQAELTTFSYDFEPGYVIPEHFHEEDQIVYASQGVMTVRTDEGIWVVPPLRAVWIPGKVVHAISMSGVVSMRTLYLVPKFVKKLPRTCVVLNVSPLLRELILHACVASRLSRMIESEKRLIEIIADQLEMSTALPLQLPHPSDPRAVRIVSILMADPSDNRTLAALCRTAGASKRTVERFFTEETKMTFGKWRQQLRLLHAMKLLASGEKVTSVALDAGYSTPSAFISMFKKVLGTSPTKYLKTSHTCHFLLRR